MDRKDVEFVTSILIGKTQSAHAVMPYSTQDQDIREPNQNTTKQTESSGFKN